MWQAGEALVLTCAACWRRGRTVGLTLWGDSAEVQGAELEQSKDAIVSVSSCRVGDFNGAPGSRCTNSFHRLRPVLRVSAPPV